MIRSFPRKRIVASTLVLLAAVPPASLVAKPVLRVDAHLAATVSPLRTIAPAATQDRDVANRGDPLPWMEQKITASEGAGGDNFGYSVAMSGSLAIVGALQTTVDGHQYQGAAYIFAKSDGVWSEVQRLTASDGAANANFGKAVAIEDGIALVGAHGATIGANIAQGAVYVFSNVDGVWTETGKLTASDGIAESNFGGALSLVADTAIFGAYNATVDGATNRGAAYVFVDADGTWMQQQELVASDGAADDQFGHSIAFDGTTAVIGAFDATVNDQYGQGAAYVFTDAGGTWTEDQKLTADDGAEGDEFSESVAVSGNRLLLGAPYAAIGDNFGEGAVYAFDHDGGTWAQTRKLVAEDSMAGDGFGYSLAIDASTAVVGANNVSVDGTAAQGAAYIFDDRNGWSETGKLTASDGGAFNYFGYSAALADSDVLIGAEFAPVDGDFGQGAAYLYARLAADAIFADGFDGP